MNDATPSSSRSPGARLLKTASSGFGYLAFAGLSTWAAERSAGPLAPKAPHFPARAKRVIFLCMEGGPSHVDTFDYKPKLIADDGKPIGKGRAATRQAARVALEIPAARRERPLGLRPVSRGRQACRRPLRRQQHADRPPEPSPGVPPVAHRDSSSSPGPRSARGCSTASEPRTRTSPASSPSARPRNNGGAVELRQRVPAGDLPGDARSASTNMPIAQAKVSNLANPKLSVSDQRKQLDLVQTLNRHDAGARPGEPGRRRGDRVVRARLPDAGRAAAGDGPGEGVESHAGSLRHRHGGDRRLRPAMPPGPALRRGRRAVHRGVSRRLGSAPASSSRPRQARRTPPTSRSPAC